MTFALKFSEHDLRSWSAKYDYATTGLNREVNRIGKSMQNKGYLSLNQLIQLCRWKTRRTKPHVKRNSDSFVREVTSIVLTSQNERFRIEVLTLLHGVSWPTASVILHFGHPDPYPIIDFRALWSLGAEVPSRYSFDFWWSYVKCCRELSERSGLSINDLDKALWQYSKEKQPISTST